MVSNHFIFNVKVIDESIEEFDQSYRKIENMN